MLQWLSCEWTRMTASTRGLCRIYTRGKRLGYVYMPVCSANFNTDLIITWRSVDIISVLVFTSTDRFIPKANVWFLTREGQMTYTSIYYNVEKVSFGMRCCQANCIFFNE